MTTTTITAVPVSLRVDHLSEPRGLGNIAPEFSWNLSSTSPGITQAAAEIELTAVSDAQKVVWGSARIDSDLPFGHRYTGPPLTSNALFEWRVRVWVNDTPTPGPWSDPATFETGILDPALWQADWVSAPAGVIPDGGGLYLRGDLPSSGTIVRARAFVSALGWYRFFVNGEDLTGPALVPRYTPLNEVIEYQTYDITAQLREGANTIGIGVGDGRFRGPIGYFNRRNTYGDRLAGFAQIHLEYDDGTSRVWGTGPSWSAGTGRIISSDPKLGERADLRVSDADWQEHPTPPARFVPVEVIGPHRRRMIAEDVARVTVTDTFRPVTSRAPSGAQLVDLGQNIAGILRLRLPALPGRKVTITLSETLTPDGELDTDWIVQNPTNKWVQQDEVILSVHAQWWQPWFTIHGFRYAQIDGLDSDLNADDVEGLALSTAVEAAGSFTSSDPLLDRLWQNVYWSTRSNFTDTPTDCPTRERSGWTGDIQVFAPTATGIVDAQAFLRRYLSNVALEQRPNGNVSPWVPSERSGNVGIVGNTILNVLGNSVGWGDVTTLTPWAMYQYYGDRTTLERQYPSMRLWVDRLERAARRRGPQRWFTRHHGSHERYILDSGFHWGEWLRPGEHYPFNMLDGLLHGASLATAYFARSARALAETAEVLGRTEDAHRYARLAGRVRDAWRAAFLRENGGRIGRDLQDDYVRAITFDLLDADEKKTAARRLVELIRRNDGHLATGFLSTPMLLAVLADTSHTEVAYQLLLDRRAPSWLAQIEQGATTIWEQWQAIDDDGYAHESLNHYALGSVAGWLREYILGIRPAVPGYRRVRISPTIGGGLTRAQGSVRTPFGVISTGWRLNELGGTVEVSLPPGVSGIVATPDGITHEVLSGDTRRSWPQPTPPAPQPASALTKPVREVVSKP